MTKDWERGYGYYWDHKANLCVVVTITWNGSDRNSTLFYGTDTTSYPLPQILGTMTASRDHIVAYMSQQSSKAMFTAYERCMVLILSHEIVGLRSLPSTWMLGASIIAPQSHL